MDRGKYSIKNSAFEGVPVWAFWAFLVPKVYFGVKTMCKKFHKVPTIGCDFPRVGFSLSPSNAVTAVTTGHNVVDKVLAIVLAQV